MSDASGQQGRGTTDPQPTIIYLGLGSNVGHRPRHLRHGLRSLQARGIDVEAVSSLYLTEPVLERPSTEDHDSGDAGPWYVNCVARVRSTLEPRRLVDLLLDVEEAAGRERRRSNVGPAHRTAGAAGEQRPGPEPRPLDLDLLLYGDVVVEGPGLVVPHPRMHLRRFVLRPLCELDPGIRHPVAERTVRSLLDKLPGGEGVWLLAPPPRLPDESDDE